jgi:hypothetical protein
MGQTSSRAQPASLQLHVLCTLNLEIGTALVLGGLNDFNCLNVLSRSSYSISALRFDRRVPGRPTPAARGPMDLRAPARLPVRTATHARGT